MSTQIVNAAPLVIFLGTNDLSKQPVFLPTEEIPQFLPKFYILSEKGPREPMLLNGNILDSIYGEESITTGSKYFTHQTLFLRKQLRRGSAMVQRLFPADAKKASITLYACVKEGEFDAFKRDSHGNIMYDVNGEKVVDATRKDTLRIAYVAKPTPANVSIVDMGDFKAYPVLTLLPSDEGEYYNNIGIGISSVPANAVTSKFMSKDGYMPLNFTVYDKSDSKARAMTTLSSSKATTGSLFPNTNNPYSKRNAYISDIFIDSNYNTTDITLPFVNPLLESLEVYSDNVEAINTMIIGAIADNYSDTAETWGDGLNSASSSWYDFPLDMGADVSLYKLINLFSCSTSTGIPFQGVAVDTTGTDIDTSAFSPVINFGPNSPVFMVGGTDGDLSTYNALVEAELNRYADPYDEVLDMSYNVESTVIDSGFPLNTKYAFANVLGLRPDMNIIFSSHVEALHGKAMMSSEEMGALAELIRFKLATHPESTYFGTSVMRAIIVGGNAIVKDDVYNLRVSQSYDLLGKISGYMGAGNGAWSSVDRFDVYPGNVLTSMDKFSPRSIPDIIKPQLWDKSLIWSERYNRTLYQYPALQTVYEEDSSIVNGLLSMFAIGTLVKFGVKAHKQFRGSQRYTKPVLKSKTEAYITALADGKFDGSFDIVPNVFYTADDLRRGFSKNIDIRIGGNTMMTVDTLRITAESIKYN